MIATRRKILQTGLTLPFVWASEPNVHILFEDHCLSAESAAGFQKVVCRTARKVIIATASRDLDSKRARELKLKVMAGAHLLFECSPDYSIGQARQLAAQFQIQVAPPMALDGAHKWAGQYVEYSHPIQRWVRPFLAAVPVRGSQATVLALLNGVPVAIQQRLGYGRVIFLGALLGPSLFAEDPDALQLAAEFFA